MRLFIALLILLEAAAPAHAAPVAAAIGAIATAVSAFSSTLIGGLLVNAALSAGLGLLQRARARRAARKAAKQNAGSYLTVQMGDTVTRSYLIGARATAGRRIYAMTWGDAGGTPNAYATDVRELSCLPSRNGPTGIDALYLDGKAVTILWAEPHPDGIGYPVQEYRVGGEDYFWVRYIDGTQTVADPWLVAKFGSHETRPYKNTMVGRGCQALIVTARRNEDLFTTGALPEILCQPTPMRLYDLRADSSTGGSGAQRWADPTTWQPSQNPAVMAYNVARGLYFGSEWVHGGRNYDAYRLPRSAFVAAANACDVVKDGRPSYRAGLQVFVDTDSLDVLEDLRVACAGRFSETGGRIKFSAGAPGAAVFAFTDGDIVITSEQDFQPFPTPDRVYNIAKAVYPEPAIGWQPKDAAEYAPAAYLAADRGEPSTISFEIDAVPYRDQVNDLIRTMLDDHRRWRTHTVVMMPSANILEAGVDSVSWTSARNGYTNKLFTVEVARRLSNGFQVVTILEVDPSDYSPPSVTLPVVSPASGPIAVPVQPMTGWTAVPAVVTDAAGAGRRPAIRIGCAAGLDDIERVLVTVMVKATGAIVFQADQTRYGAPYSWLLSGTWCLKSTLYQVIGQYIPFTRRPTAPSDPIDVLTPDVGDTDLTVELANIGQSVNAVFRDLYTEMDDYFRPRLRELEEAFSLLGALGEVQRRQLRVEIGRSLAQIVEEARVRASGDDALAQLYTALTATVGANLARLVTEETARATADSALASSITALSATVGTNLARLQTEEVARASADAALASSLTALSSEVDGVQADLITEQSARSSGDGALASSISGVNADFNGRFAQGLVKFEAASAPSGVTARYAVLLRANSGASFVQSGFFLDIYDAGGGSLASRMAINVDQFVVFSGSHVASPLVFEDGILKLINAKIAQAQIDNLLVGTTNIEVGAITQRASFADDSDSECERWQTGVWSVVAEVTLNHGPDAGPIAVIGSGKGSGQDGLLAADLYDVSGGRVLGRTGIRQVSGSTLVGEPIDYEPFSISGIVMPPAGRSSTTVQLRARGFNTSSTRNQCSNRGLVAFSWKR